MLQPKIIQHLFTPECIHARFAGKLPTCSMRIWVSSRSRLREDSFLRLFWHGVTAAASRGAILPRHGFNRSAKIEGSWWWWTGQVVSFSHRQHILHRCRRARAPFLFSHRLSFSISRAHAGTHTLAPPPPFHILSPSLAHSPSFNHTRADLSLSPPLTHTSAMLATTIVDAAHVIEHHSIFGARSAVALRAAGCRAVD